MQGIARHINGLSPLGNRHVAKVTGRAYYVDATSGSDSNDGTGAPWQTIAKVNATTFQPGDKILFKCGETWADTTLTIPSSGASGTPIVFDAYGGGAAPILDASTKVNALDTHGQNFLTIQNIHCKGAVAGSCVHISSHHVSLLDCIVEGDVAQLSNGIVCDNGSFPAYSIVIRGNIVFNHKVKSGGGAGIIVGSSANPGLTDVLVENNQVYNNGTNVNLDHGIYLAQTVDGVTVRNNTIYSNASNGISLNGVVTNSLIERNVCYLNGQAGVILGTIGAAAGNVIRNNLLYTNVQAGLQISGNCLSAAIYHNTLVNNSNGAGTGYGVHLTTLGTSGVIFKDNAVYQDATVVGGQFCQPIRVGNAGILLAATGNVFDYNDYYYLGQTNSKIGNVAGTNKTLAEWQAMTGSPDPNSLAVDPVFVTNYTDLHLQSSSPCRNAGVDVGATNDYDGHARPMGAAVDIGAYEFVE
jgi:hypothetical protein